MKSSSVLALSSVSFIAAMALMPGCSDDSSSSSSSSSSSGSSGDAGDGAVAIREFGIPNHPCTDSADSLYADPGALPATKGEIIKCHEDPTLSADTLQKRLDELGYKGKPLTSGARVYRVLYRTERGDAANTAGTSSALVYIPSTPRANNLPVIVASRGTRGQAPDCTASKKKEGLGVNDDLDRLAYSVVGHGYAVLVPDLSGYANFGASGNPPPAYAQAQDVGKATLDGTRALKKLFPNNLSGKTVLTGHSQGGHTALAATALVDSYGIEGDLAGVAVYAPLWLSQRTWGAILSPAIADQQMVTIKNQEAASAVSVWYHYTQAELLDGPGEGVKLFKPEFQAGIKSFVETECYAPPFTTLEGMGTYIWEVFDQQFTADVSDAAAGLGACPSDNAVCQKWVKRYTDDRPHLTGKAAQVPLLMLWGGQDTTIPPGRLRCALDRLTEDGTNLSICYDATLTHQTILDQKSDYVADWIGGVALGEAAPAKCAGGLDEVSVVAPKCATPPPND